MRTVHGYSRLVGFSDGVVAIAITLLILPLVESASDFHGDVGGFLAAHVTQLLIFLLSFAVIGNFWTVHHQMWEQVTSYTRGLLWANLLWLLSIVFLPFPTELLASSNNDRATYALYIGTMVVTTLAELIQQAIIVRNPQLQAESIRGTLSAQRYLVPVGILLVALALAVAFPTTIGLWGLGLFALNGVIGRMVGQKKKAI